MLIVSVLDLQRQLCRDKEPKRLTWQGKIAFGVGEILYSFYFDISSLNVDLLANSMEQQINSSRPRCQQKKVLKNASGLKF